MDCRRWAGSRLRKKENDILRSYGFRRLDKRFSPTESSRTKASFLARLHRFTCASRRRASLKESCSSEYASSTGRSSLVVRHALPCSCSRQRRSTSVVEPTYSLPDLRRRMYIHARVETAFRLRPSTGSGLRSRPFASLRFEFTIPPHREEKRGLAPPASKWPAMSERSESNGSSARARTSNLVVNSHPLYQLSYRGSLISRRIIYHSTRSFSR